jgi:hypothetical protein
MKLILDFKGVFLLKFFKNKASPVKILYISGSWICYHLEDFFVYFLLRTATSRTQIIEGLAVRGRIKRMMIGYSAGNPPEEGNSAGRCHPMDEESTG